MGKTAKGSSICMPLHMQFQFHQAMPGNIVQKSTHKQYHYLCT